MTGAVPRHLARMILSEGPLPLDKVMALALTAPEGGYYTGKDPFGAAGDFTTAPEISQMFGEMVGAFLLQSWMEMGEPAAWSLIELGPGRGTLMADILRVFNLRPQALAGAEIHLIEVSPALRDIQSRKLQSLTDRPIRWHTGLAGIPEGPALIIANEFFDALPIRQLVFKAEKWFERCVKLDPQSPEEKPVFEFTLLPLQNPPPPPREAEACYEICPTGRGVAGEIGLRFLRSPGRALIVDYGYWGPLPGDTFQALRSHAAHDPLADLGSADLTAHVDFEALARAAQRAGAAAYGPVTQGDLLMRLGIGARAAALGKKDPQTEAALTRLTAPDQMGTLFKAICLSAPNMPPPPGFDLDRAETAL